MSETSISNSMSVNHQLLVMALGRGISHGGVLTPESKLNARYAALFAAIWNAPLLLSGNNPDGTDDYQFSEAFAMAKYIQGLYPDWYESWTPNISLDQTPDSTFKNISGLSRKLNRGEIYPFIQEVVLVAGEEQLRRALGITAQCAMFNSISVWGFPSYGEPLKERIVEKVLTRIALFATKVIEPYSPDRLDQAGSLYQWMIAPVKAPLERTGIHSGRRNTP